MLFVADEHVRFEHQKRLGDIPVHIHASVIAQTIASLFCGALFRVTLRCLSVMNSFTSTSALTLSPTSSVSYNILYNPS